MFNPVNIHSDQDYDKDSSKYRLELFVTFEKFNIYRAQIHENNGATKLMFPEEARNRNFTYAGNMTIDMNIKYIVRTGTSLESEETFYKIMPNINIGKIPIMWIFSICIFEQYKHLFKHLPVELLAIPSQVINKLKCFLEHFMHDFR